jgi:hypothetical protein
MLLGSYFEEREYGALHFKQILLDFLGARSTDIASPAITLLLRIPTSKDYIVGKLNPSF